MANPITAPQDLGFGDLFRISANHFDREPEGRAHLARAKAQLDEARELLNDLAHLKGWLPTDPSGLAKRVNAIAWLKTFVRLMTKVESQFANAAAASSAAKNMREEAEAILDVWLPVV